MRATSATVMIIFWKCHSERHLITTMLKFLLNICEAHWQQHFERDPTVVDFTDMDEETCWFFHKDFTKHHETKINEVVLKIITCRENATPHFKEYCTKIDDISLVITRFFFSQTNLVFKSSPVLTYWIVFTTVCLHFYLFISDILRILNFIQCLYVFFYKSQ